MAHPNTWEVFSDIASMDLPALTTLALGDVSNDPNGHFRELPTSSTQAIFTAPCMDRLEHLSLEWVTLDESFVEALGRYMTSRASIRTLDVHRCWITPKAAELLLRRRLDFARLENLCISPTGLSEDTRDALCKALPDCRFITDDWIDHWASPPWRAGIELRDYFVERGGRRQIDRAHDALKRHGVVRLHVYRSGADDWVLQVRELDFPRAARALASNLTNESM